MQGFYKVHKQLSTDFLNKELTAGEKHSLHYSFRYTKNQDLEFISQRLESMTSFVCNNFRNKSNVTFIKCKGSQASKQFRKTFLVRIRVWAHVYSLISLCGSVTSCLVSGSSWNLTGAFLLENSASQHICCLLPAFFEIKK